MLVQIMVRACSNVKQGGSNATWSRPPAINCNQTHVILIIPAIKQNTVYTLNSAWHANGLGITYKDKKRRTHEGAAISARPDDRTGVPPPHDTTADVPTASLELLTTKR